MSRKSYIGRERSFFAQLRTVLSKENDDAIESFPPSTHSLLASWLADVAGGKRGRETHEDRGATDCVSFSQVCIG